MIINKQATRLIAIFTLLLPLAGCSVFDWLVYKPDLSQGNYMEPQQVAQLRIHMTKEQVEYILGRPVLRDSFADDTWYYVYHFKNGRNAKITHKELLLHFNGNILVNVSGDYKLSPDFNVPLNQSTLPASTNQITAPDISDSQTHTNIN